MLIRVATVTDTENYRVKVPRTHLCARLTDVTQCVMMSPGVFTCRSIMTAGRSSLTSGVTATTVTSILWAGANARDTRWSPPQVRQTGQRDTG